MFSALTGLMLHSLKKSRKHGLWFLICVKYSHVINLWESFQSHVTQNCDCHFLDLLAVGLSVVIFSPRSRFASWISFAWRVTRFAWMATRLASSRRLTRKASAASWDENKRTKEKACFIRLLEATYETVVSTLMELRSAHWWNWGRRIDETIVEAQLKILLCQNVDNNFYLKTFDCIFWEIFNGCVVCDRRVLQKFPTQTIERQLSNEKIVAFLVLSYFLQSFGSCAIFLFWLVTWCLRRSIPRDQFFHSFSLALAISRRLCVFLVRWRR